MSQPISTTLHSDNLSAVYLSTNPALHSRSKHFDTDHHYIREQVALGLIETHHIPAKLQLADIFTKPLSRKLFLELRGKLGVQEMTTSLRGNVRQETMGLDTKAHDGDTKRRDPNIMKNTVMRNRGSTASSSTENEKTKMTKPALTRNRFDIFLSLQDDEAPLQLAI